MAGRRPPATRSYGGRPAAERRAERRQRLLAAGLDLFGADPGYQHTRTAEVIRAAGLTTRQFYEEFHSLEDLLFELYLRIRDSTEGAVAAVLPEAAGMADLVERHRFVLRTYAVAATADPRHARIAHVEVVGVSPRLDRQRLEHRSRWTGPLVEQLHSAAGQGLIPPSDFHLSAASYLAAASGLMHDWTAGWVEATLDQIVDELTRMFLSSHHFGDTDPRTTLRRTTTRPPH